MKKHISLLLVIILMITVPFAAFAERTIMGEAGEANSFFVKDDGALFAVGQNENGQLGTGDNINKSSMVKIMDGVSAVSAGGAHTLVLKSDGTLYAMGMNKYGQLGNGSVTDLNSAVKIMDNVASMDAGYSYSAAVKTDGTVWIWGYNEKGRLDKDKDNAVSIPVQIESGAKAVACGRYELLILKNDNTLWSGFAVSDLVSFAGNVSLIDNGREHNAYIDSGLSVYLWGLNAAGQLGNGSLESSKVPVKISDDVKGVAAGNSHTLFVKNDGTLWAMGDNKSGQIGDGTLIGRVAPVKVLTDVYSISSSADHNIAIKNDGSVWGWGDNRNGQLTSYNKNIVATPVKLSVDVFGGQPSEWAASEVNAAKQKSLVTAELSGNYQKDITREEFADLIINMLRKAGKITTTPAESPFSDTSSPNIILANSLGIVNGTGDGEFSPYKNIDRQQIATMFERMIKNIYPEQADIPVGDNKFADDGSIQEWASEGVYFVNAAGIVNGVGENRFDPEGKCTAEQAILIMLRTNDIFN